MAKRRFSRATRAADKVLNKPTISPISKGTQPTLHRGRKKRLQTKQRIQEKNQFIQAELERIEQDKSVKQKQKQDPILKGLNDLSGVLELGDDSAAEQGLLRKNEKSKGKLSSKQRLKIIQVEKDQVKRVQTHEAYVNNPMEALRRHLNNTVSPNGFEIPKSDTVLTKKNKQNKQHGKDEKEAKNSTTKIANHKSLMMSEATLKKATEDARQRVESKRQYKQVLSEVARRRSAKQQASKIRKQTAISLLSKSRIGVKRAKLS